MTTLIVQPSDLATYLGLPEIDSARAALIIRYAQDRCEDIVSPLPDTAAGIVCRVAARAYLNVGSMQSMSLGGATANFGAPSPFGVSLTRSDKRDLRVAAGGGGAFSIDLLPDTAAQNLAIWDVATPSLDNLL